MVIAEFHNRNSPWPTCSPMTPNSRLESGSATKTSLRVFDGTAPAGEPENEESGIREQGMECRAGQPTRLLWERLRY